jgi:cell division protein FtsZ
MAPDEVKITIVATGFEDPNAVSEPSVKKQETLLSNTTAAGNLNNLRSKMVVGGYNDNEDILDVPTFLRKQMD